VVSASKILGIFSLVLIFTVMAIMAIAPAVYATTEQSSILLEGIKSNKENISYIIVTWGSTRSEIPYNSSYIEKLEVNFPEFNIRQEINVVIKSNSRILVNLTLKPTLGGYRILRLDIAEDVEFLKQTFIRVKEALYQITLHWQVEPQKPCKYVAIDAEKFNCDASVAFASSPNETHLFEIAGEEYLITGTVKMPSNFSSLEITRQISGNVTRAVLVAVPRISILEFYVNAPTTVTTPVRNLTELGVRDVAEIYLPEGVSYIENSQQHVIDITLPSATPFPSWVTLHPPEVDLIKVGIVLALALLFILLTPRRKVLAALLWVLIFLLLMAGGFLR